MARTRLLRPAFFNDPKFCRLSMGARHLCLGLIPHLDRNGVFYGNPQTVRSHVFPHTQKLRVADVDRWLKELHDASRVVGCDEKMPRVRLFNYDDTEYLVDLNFHHHQTVYANDPAIYGVPVETLSRVLHDLIAEESQLIFDPLNQNQNLNLDQIPEQKNPASKGGSCAPHKHDASELDDLAEAQKLKELLIRKRVEQGLEPDGSSKV